MNEDNLEEAIRRSQKCLISKTGIRAYDERVTLTKGNIYYALTDSFEERFEHYLEIARKAVYEENKNVLIIHKNEPGQHIIDKEIDVLVNKSKGKVAGVLLTEEPGTLTDFLNKIWEVYQFHFDMIVLDVSEFNGEERRELAKELDTLVDSFQSEGFLAVITDQITELWLDEVNKGKLEIATESGPIVSSSIYQIATHANSIFTYKYQGKKEKLIVPHKSLNWILNKKTFCIKLND